MLGQCSCFVSVHTGLQRGLFFSFSVSITFWTSTHAQLLSCVQLPATLWMVAHQAPPSQASILGWVAISSSRGSSRPRDRTCISCIGRRILYLCTTWEALHLDSQKQSLAHWLADASHCDFFVARSYWSLTLEGESHSIVSDSLLTPWTIQSMEFSRPEYWSR